MNDPTFDSIRDECVASLRDEAREARAVMRSAPLGSDAWSDASRELAMLALDLRALGDPRWFDV